MTAQSPNEMWNSDLLADACSRMESSGLISIRIREPLGGFGNVEFTPCFTLTMHPLIHDWAWKRQSQEQQQASLITTGSLLGLAVCDSVWSDRYRLPHLVSYVRIWQQHKSNFRTCASGLCISQIIFQCARSVRGYDDDMALQCLDHIAGQQLDQGRLHGLEHVEFGLLWAETRREAEDLDGYIQLMTQILDLEEDLPEDDEERLKYRHDLTEAYLSNNQVSEAVFLYEHIFNGLRSVCSEDDSNLLYSQELLADAYCRSGRRSQCISLLEHVVKVRRRSWF